MYRAAGLRRAHEIAELGSVTHRSGWAMWQGTPALVHAAAPRMLERRSASQATGCPGHQPRNDALAECLRLDGQVSAWWLVASVELHNRCDPGRVQWRLSDGDAGPVDSSPRGLFHDVTEPVMPGPPWSRASTSAGDSRPRCPHEDPGPSWPPDWEPSAREGRKVIQ